MERLLNSYPPNLASGTRRLPVPRLQSALEPPPVSRGASYTLSSPSSPDGNVPIRSSSVLFRETEPSVKLLSSANRDLRTSTSRARALLLASATSRDRRVSTGVPCPLPSSLNANWTAEGPFPGGAGTGVVQTTSLNGESDRPNRVAKGPGYHTCVGSQVLLVSGLPWVSYTPCANW